MPQQLTDQQLQDLIRRKLAEGVPKEEVFAFMDEMQRQAPPPVAPKEAPPMPPFGPSGYQPFIPSREEAQENLPGLVGMAVGAAFPPSIPAALAAGGLSGATRYGIERQEGRSPVAAGVEGAITGLIEGGTGLLPGAVRTFLGNRAQGIGRARLAEHVPAKALTEDVINARTNRPFATQRDALDKLVKRMLSRGDAIGTVEAGRNMDRSIQSRLSRAANVNLDEVPLYDAAARKKAQEAIMGGNAAGQQRLKEDQILQRAYSAATNPARTDTNVGEHFYINPGSGISPTIKIFNALKPGGKTARALYNFSRSKTSGTGANLMRLLDILRPHLSPNSGDQ